MKLFGNTTGGKRQGDRRGEPAVQRRGEQVPAAASLPDEGDHTPEAFEIDWDAVWAREEAERRQRQQQQRPGPAQAPGTGAVRPAPPDYVIGSRGPGSLPAAEQRAAPPAHVRQPPGRSPSAWEDDTFHPAPRRRPDPNAEAVRRAKAGGQRADEGAAGRKAAGPSKPKKRRWLRNTGLALILLAGLYCTAVFSNIPFIAKWRAIYIETAMGTMTHQWLATAFIPPSVIDKVVGGREELEAEQAGLESDWGSHVDLGGQGQADTSPWKKLSQAFFEGYPEIDQPSFEAYMAEHEGEAINSDGYLMIDKAGLKDGGTDIETVHGDQVLAVDTVNGITICKVTGEGYVGRLAIIKDPSRVGVALAPGYGNVGAKAAAIAEKRDAVLLTNASGFYDPEGHGNGGVAHGLVVSQGKRYNDPVGGTYKTIGIDENDRLHVGAYKSGSQYRDAVEFKPALIVNGEQVVKGSAGWGVQPRTAIGQTEAGDILLLVVDGRAPGYSIGCTVGDCAEILAKYGAVQACNLDGGSSSIMIYNGREISRPSAADKEKGRHIPDGIAVYAK